MWVLVLCMNMTQTSCGPERYEFFKTEAACQRRAAYYDPNRDFSKNIVYCIRRGTKQINSKRQ